MALRCAAKFFWFVLFQFLTLLLFTYYGMMAVSVSPSVQMAAVISSAFYSIWFLFTGKHPRLLNPCCPSSFHCPVSSISIATCWGAKFLLAFSIPAVTPCTVDRL